jgi:WD40 repeat protein
VSMDITSRKPAKWPFILFVCFILAASGAFYLLLRDPTAKIRPRFYPSALVFAPDGTALGASDGFGVELYSLPEYKSALRIPFPDPLDTDVVAWKADLSQVALAAESGTSVEIRDVRSNAVARSLPSTAPGEIILGQGPDWTSSTLAPEALTRLVWSPDGRYLAILRYSGAVQLWDLQTNNTMTVPAQSISLHGCLAWSADSRRLMFSDDNVGRLVIYSAPDFAEPLRLESEESCSQIALHPNGKLLAQHSDLMPISHTPTIEVWNIGEMLRIGSHEAEASLLAWHPTEEVLAIAYRGRLELWRPFDDQAVVLSERDDDRITAIAFSPDGREILLSTDDGRVRAWPLAERAPTLFQ